MLQTHFFHQNATFFTHHALMTTIRGVVGFLLEDTFAGDDFRFYE